VTERGLYPKAVHRLIPPGANDPAIRPRLAILHVDAGNADSLYDYFAHRSGGIESHFFVKKDGTVEQYRSIYFQADANLDANDFAVSIETQGFAAGEWNDAQLKSIKELLLWLHVEAGIPLSRCKTWDGSGIGYHTMFGAPSHWTPVSKTCPGPDRIKQFDSVLTRWMAWRRAVEKARLFKPRHRVVSVNIKQGNPRPLAAVNRLIAKAKVKFRWVPDVIAFQEARFVLDQLALVEGYTLQVSRTDEAGRELAVLLRDRLKCLGTEYTRAADGTGSGVFDHPRGIFVVKYLKRRRKVALVNTHMGLVPKVDTDHTSDAAKQHAAHARLVASKVAELKAAGFLVFVTADANSVGKWPLSLPAVLAQAGLQLSQNHIDVVASDPSRVGAAEVLVIPQTVIESDHDAVVIQVQEK
jgi:hypothetical protein